MDRITSRGQLWLLILLLANVVATVLHFTDNFIFIDDYPQPDWINVYHVVLYWLIMTLLGIVSYFLYKRGFYSSSYLCSYAYSAMTLVSLGHYLYAPIWELSLKMNAFLLFEIFTAITLAGFTLWLQVSPSAQEET